VVVENVERNIELGHPPVEAAHIAMAEVTGPIISTALVLCAVFIPTAFITGLTGQFYRQFALTIAISTVISAFNSLTLSPALSALLLKAHGAPKDRFQQVIDRAFGWLFRPFNKAFAWASHAYVGGVGRAIGKSPVALAAYAGLIGLTVLAFVNTPGGFVPAQDKLYLVAALQLPDAASLDRTEAVTRKVSAIAMHTPGVSGAVAFPGLSINGQVNSSNAGVVFLPLDDFSKRHGPGLSAIAIATSLNQQFTAIPDGSIQVFPPPPVFGLGSIGGFRMQLEDRSGLGPAALNKAVQDIETAAARDPRLAGVFSSYQIGVPKIHADIDREKAKAQGVSLTDIFTTMQVYLGSVYVNDFNRFGRTYQVNVQADQRFRMQPQDIARLQSRWAPSSPSMKRPARSAPPTTTAILPPRSAAARRRASARARRRRRWKSSPPRPCPRAWAMSGPS